MTLTSLFPVFDGLDGYATGLRHRPQDGTNILVMVENTLGVTYSVERVVASAVVHWRQCVRRV